MQGAHGPGAGSEAAVVDQSGAQRRWCLVCAEAAMSGLVSTVVLPRARARGGVPVPAPSVGQNRAEAPWHAMAAVRGQCGTPPSVGLVIPTCLTLLPEGVLPQALTP